VWTYLGLCNSLTPASLAEQLLGEGLIGVNAALPTKELVAALLRRLAHLCGYLRIFEYACGHACVA
jgi:hypothetical protein